MNRLYDKIYNKYLPLTPLTPQPPLRMDCASCVLLYLSTFQTPPSTPSTPPSTLHWFFHGSYVFLRNFRLTGLPAHIIVLVTSVA
jgi:hypothetical protein